MKNLIKIGCLVMLSSLFFIPTNAHNDTGIRKAEVKRGAFGEIISVNCLKSGSGCKVKEVPSTPDEG